MKKTIKEPSIQHLALNTLFNYQLSRQLGPAFFQAITQKALLDGFPDVLISQFDKDDNTSGFLTELVQTQQAHPRYQNGSALVIIDHHIGKALLFGTSFKTNLIVDTAYPIENLTATVVQAVKLQAPHIQGAVISDALSKP